MTKVFVVPLIAKRDYEAFRREVGPNLADTYDEWAKLFADDREEAIRQGKTLIEVEIYYDEFMAYCRTTGTKPDAKVLLNFAVKKSRRQQ